MNNQISPAAISLAGLAVEYCKVLSAENVEDTKSFIREVLRYLPRIYVTISDLDNGQGRDDDWSDGGVFYDSVTEEQYQQIQQHVSSILGQHDMYLDTPADQMQYSDTPVAVSLAEQLADIYQCMGDFAATVGQITPDLIDEVLAELKNRFRTYLSDILCSALRAANNLYQHADFQE